jgi:uracil-DNA glycosylase
VFGHGVQVTLTDPVTGRELHLLGSYHPSQRNVFTGILTPAMLEDVLGLAAQIAGLDVPG